LQPPRIIRKRKETAILQIRPRAKKALFCCPFLVREEQFAAGWVLLDNVNFPEYLSYLAPK
jgi:hypothetical protein